MNETKLLHFANMSDICKHIKLLAEQLANVDCPVSEHKMVMQIITGLSPGQFDTLATIISQSEPTPSFNKARSMFLLKETRLNKQEENRAHALVTQHFDGSTTSSSTPTQPPIQQQGSSHAGTHRKSKGNHNGAKYGKPRGRGTNNEKHQAPQWAYGWAPIPQGKWASQPCPYPTDQ